jgi:hypothetical protein
MKEGGFLDDLREDRSDDPDESGGDNGPGSIRRSFHEGVERDADFEFLYNQCKIKIIL